MKRYRLAYLLCLLWLLTGCVGDVASPTDSHDRTQTTTTTTVTTQTAELAQSNNKSVCVGLINIGSCNNVQVNQQDTVSEPAVAPVATASDTNANAEAAMWCLGAFGLLGVFLLLMVAMTAFSSEQN